MDYETRGRRRREKRRRHPQLRQLRLEQLEQRRLLALSSTGSDLPVGSSDEWAQYTFPQSPAPVVAVDAEGDFALVWASDGRDGSGYGVYAQQFDRSGSPLGDDFQVNTTAQYDQTFPAIAMDAAGNFLISWSSLNQDAVGYGVYAQRFDATGQPQGDEFPVNTTVQGNQNFSAVAMGDQGRSVITWTSQDQDGSGTGIFGRRFAADGTPLSDEFPVNLVTDGNQRYSSVAMDAVGNFVVSWTGRDGSGDGIFGRRFGVDGQPIGDEVAVNTTTDATQQFSSVAVSDGGQFVVAWQGYDTAGGTWNVHAQQFDPAGEMYGEEMDLGGGRFPATAMTATADFVIAWQSYDPANKDLADVYLQHFDSLGMPVGDRTQVVGDQGAGLESPSIAIRGEHLALFFTGEESGGWAETFDVDVSSEANHPPVFSPIDDQTVHEGELVEIVATAIDPDDPDAALAFSLGTNPPAGAQIDPTTGRFTWTPGENDGGSEWTITIRATDTAAIPQTGRAVFTVTVLEVNEPITIDSIDDQTIEEGELLSLLVTVSDPDITDDVPFFMLTSDPPLGANIDPTSGFFTWTPSEDQGPGDYRIEIKVNDGGSPETTDVEEFWVHVEEANIPPQIENIARQWVTQGETLELTVVATDPDVPANGITFSLASSAPPGATIDPITGQFVWQVPLDFLAGEQTVRVRATDDGQPSRTATSDFVVRVGPSLLDPMLTKSVDETSELVFHAAAKAPYDSAEGFTYSLDESAPAGATIDPATGEFRWTPDEDHGPGTYPVTVTLTDTDGTYFTAPDNSDAQAFLIVVNEVNRAPKLGPIADQTIAEGVELSLTVTATDHDVPANELRFSLVGVVPDGATVDESSGLFRWTPGEGLGQSGEPVEVTVIVVDDGVAPLSDSATFQITVTAANQAPVVEPIDDRTIEVGQRLLFTVAADDPDVPGDLLTFTLSEEPPAGVYLDTGTGRFTWLPTLADVDTHEFTIMVTDDGNPPRSASESFSVTVEAAMLEPIADQSVDEGQTLIVTAALSDGYQSSGDLVFYLEPGAPAGTSIVPASGTFTWTPGEEDGPGIHTISIRLASSADPLLTDTETFLVTVHEVNQPPSITPIGDQTIGEGNTWTFQVVAADPDGTPAELTWQLENAPPGLMVDPDTGLLTWTPSEQQGPDTFENIRLIVTDGDSASFTTHFTLRVTETNTPPQLEPIDDQWVDQGEAFMILALASDSDEPANSPAFSLPEAPPGAMIGSQSGLFVWATDPDQPAGQYDVTIRVGDGGTPELEDTVSFTITVDTPLLEPIPDQEIAEGQTLALTAVATSPYDPIVDGLSFGLGGSVPPGAEIDAKTGLFTWTPTEDQGSADYTISVMLTDDADPTISDRESFTVTVTEELHAPEIGPIGDQTVELGETLQVQVEATDADLPGDTLRFGLAPGAPRGARIDPDSGLITWMTGGRQPLGDRVITVYVSDGTTTPRAEESFTMTVEQALLEPINDQSINEEQTLSLFARFSKPYGPSDGLKFRLGADAPEGASLDSDSGLFTWTPTEEQGPSVQTLTVWLLDDADPSQYDSETFRVTVGEVPHPPVIGPIDPITIDEETTWSWSLPVTDQDSSAEELAFALVGEVPAGMTLDTTNGLVTWTPTEAQGPGTFQIHISVTDETSNAQKAVLPITVTEVNRPPVFEPIDDRTVEPGQVLALQAIVIDADMPLNRLTFHLAGNLPPEARIHRTNGQFTWEVASDQPPGQYDALLTVRDDADPALAAEVSFSIVVEPPMLEPIGDRVIDEGATLALFALPSKPYGRGDGLKFRLGDGAPTGATIDAESGHFTWTTTEADGPGVYPITVLLENDTAAALVDTETFMVTVRELNRPPELLPIDDQSVEPGETVSLVVMAEDPDRPADQLIYHLGQDAPLGTRLHRTTGEFSWEVPLDQPQGVYMVILWVTDRPASGMQDFEAFSITVNQRTEPTLLEPIANQEVQAGETLALAAVLSKPYTLADGLKFSLGSTSPEGATIDAESGLFQWTPVEDQPAGTYAITLRLTDDARPQISDAQTFLVTVTISAGNPGHPGDANLDGMTDLSDFNIWNANKFTAGADRSTGDFNDDGNTDLSDFNIWNANKFTQVVPPPPAHDVVLQQATLEPAATIAQLADLLTIDRKDNVRQETESAVDLLLASYWQ